MPEPITCCVIALVAGGGGAGAGIGIYANHEEIRAFFVSTWSSISNLFNRNPLPMTEAQRIELSRIRQAQENRQTERSTDYTQLVRETEEIAEHLHQDSKETLVKIDATIDSIGESTSTISDQTTELVQVKTRMEARMMKQKEAFDRLEQDLREKITRLETTISDLTQFKKTQLSVHEKEKSEFAEKFEMQEKALEKLCSEKRELTSSHKKLLEQINSLKKVIEQQDTQLQKKDTLLSEQDRQLDERDHQILELQEARVGTAPSSRPRFFSQ